MLINKLTKTVFDKRFPKQAKYEVVRGSLIDCDVCGDEHDTEEEATECRLAHAGE